MTGPEHYREAERLIAHTNHSVRDRFGQGDITDGAECARQQIAMAQVHATLALAAATALGMAGPDVVTEDDYRPWEAVAGASKAAAS